MCTYVYVYMYIHMCIHTHIHTNVWLVEHSLGSSLSYSEPGTCLRFFQGIDPYVSNILSNPVPLTSRGGLLGIGVSGIAEPPHIGLPWTTLRARLPS